MYRFVSLDLNICDVGTRNKTEIYFLKFYFNKNIFCVENNFKLID